MLGGFWCPRLVSSAVLLSRFRIHQGQAAAGVALLAVLQRLIPAVGFDLNGDGAGLGIDDQFVEELLTCLRLLLS